MRKFFLLILAILSVFFIHKSVYAQSPNPCIDDVDINSTYLNKVVSTGISTGGKYNSVDVCLSQSISLVQKGLNGKCSLTSSQTATIKKACEEWMNGTPPTPLPLNDYPSPTSFDSKDCGNKDKACCVGDITNSNPVSLGDQDTVFGFISVSGIIHNIGMIFYNAIGGLFGQTSPDSELSGSGSLKELGFCKETGNNDTGPDVDLIPAYESNQNMCFCRELAAGANSYQLCQQYIQPAVANILSSKDPQAKKNYANELNKCVSCMLGKTPLPPNLFTPTPTLFPGQPTTDPSIPTPAPLVPDGGGVWTSMGCIYTSSPSKFIENNVMPIALGLGGIAALLCIAFAAISFQISAGNPEKVKNAQQMITSCITGLILIIFAIFILRLIGVDILGIPGLGVK